jgi:hypothetical protein
MSTPLGEKDWLDLHRGNVEGHYSLWNYHWIVAGAAIAVAYDLVPDGSAALVETDAKRIVSLLAAGFVGFAFMNCWLLVESQLQKTKTYLKIGAENAVGYRRPWSFLVVIASVLVVDVLVITILGIIRGDWARPWLFSGW